MTVPLVIVSGYLGAGKTTLINAFFRDPQGLRASVLVNDFGAINLDADLIENSDGETIALTNGCACCAIGDDLLAAARKAVAGGPDLLLVEASGVAEPKRMAMLLRGVSGLLPGAVATAINAEVFERNRKDKFISRLFKSQIASAHYLLVNRWETDQTSLREFLASTAPGADCIDSLGEIALTTPANAAPMGIEEPDHLPGFESIALQLTDQLDLKELEKVLSRAPASIERAKGLVETTNGRYWIDFVQGVFTARQASEPMQRMPSQLVAVATNKSTLLDLKETLIEAGP